MASIPFLIKDDSEFLSVPAQIDSLGNSSINHALTAVAQEVAGLLQQAYPIQTGSNNPTRMMACGWSETIAIRAIEPEYRQIITAEPLTERELEVLQLIVDGRSNDAIAQELYISSGTVKTHVRNILKKLCASGRTQAAIRALRSGLAH